MISCGARATMLRLMVHGTTHARYLEADSQRGHQHDRGLTAGRGRLIQIAGITR